MYSAASFVASGRFRLGLSFRTINTFWHGERCDSRSEHQFARVFRFTSGSVCCICLDPNSIIITLAGSDIIRWSGTNK